jgi:3-oxoacyl-[acyl-carrier-protein] synthase-1
MSLAIAEFGMVTAVGHGAVTSCAAIRAGLSRAASLPDVKVLEPDTHTMMPAVGHSVFGLTEGRSAVARWLALARRAFEDLRGNGRLPGADDRNFWNRTALVLVVPAVDDERFMFFEPFNDGGIQEVYVRPLMRSLGIPLGSDRVFLLAEGRTGAVRAFAGMQALIERLALDRVIVLAADSYLDGHSIEWLIQSDRMKQADAPSGLMPGEAGAAVLIEREEATQARGAAPRARITAAVVDSEAQTFLDKKRKHGRAIARVFRAVLQHASAPFSGDLLVDLNGEGWRAYEFGAALTQVPRTLLDGYRVLTPAMSIGEVGAASLVVSLILAVRGFERGYAAASSALIGCVSSSGRVGAVLVGRH